MSLWARALLALARALSAYIEWSRENVRVTKDRCHVKTVRIIAELEPDPEIIGGK